MWRCLTTREADLCLLMKEALSQYLGCHACDHHNGSDDQPVLGFDFGEPASHSKMFTPDMLQVLTKGHDQYWVNGDRVFMGLELLQVQGFPRDIDLGGVPHAVARGMAGNTKSVQFVSILNAFALISASARFTLRCV